MIIRQMPEEPESYYAVIPSAILDDERVSGSAKLLYAKISALTRKRGYCWASNGWLAELRKATPRSVQNWLAELRDAGYIEAEITEAEGNTRKIWLTHKISRPSEENFARGSEENFATPAGRSADPNSKREKSKRENPQTPKGAEGMELLLPLWKNRLGAIFNRKPAKPWQTDELAAFKKICPIDENELFLIERYYASERKKEKNICRTTLLRLMKYWPGEVDRASTWAKRADFAKRRRSGPAPVPVGPATDKDFKRAGEVAKAELERFRAKYRNPKENENENGAKTNEQADKNAD